MDIEILNEKYEVMEIIGEGSFGIIYKVFNKKNSTIQAMKKFKLNFEECCLS